MELYDTHAHLDYPDFNHDLDKVIERAIQSGVSRIVTVGTNLNNSRRAIEISEKYPQVFAAIGWHPSFAQDAPDNIADELLKLGTHRKVVAIGETGLDFYRLPTKENPSLKDEDLKIIQKQREIFTQQLEVAAKLGLNVIVHQRDSVEETFNLLSAYKNKVKAVFHCFTDTEETLKRVLENGWLVSFTGIVTFKNAENVRAVVKLTPLSSMMVETDCPFLAPVPHRGERCEPAHVAITAETIAKIRNCPISELAEITSATARQFFRFDKTSQS
jgi:TatD DNase family protein